MKYKRSILGLILLFLLIFLMFYSSLQYEKKEYDILYIFEKNKTHEDKIKVTGEIVEINNTNQTLTIRLSEPPYSLKKIKINNIDFKEYTPQKRDIVELLGTNDEYNNIIAEKILIFEHWKHDLIYIRSLPAIPFALYLFFKAYRFNKKNYRFERRKPDA